MAEHCAYGANTGGEASRYARIRYRLWLVDTAAGLAFLAAYQASGASAMTARWVVAWAASEWLQVFGYLAIFGVCCYLVFFPLQFYRGFLLEHRFGLSRLTLKGWVIRELKHVAVGAVLGVLLLEGLYALLRYAPGHWTWWAAAGWVGVSIVLARIFPTILLPIFYKTAPLRDEGLVARLLTLCRRVGLRALGVFRVELGVETRKANAALAGLGKSRRVLLSDTLLEHFTGEEIETVLAHELGHQRYRHITKLLCLTAGGALIAFTLVDRTAAWWMVRSGVVSLADVAGFPMLILSLSLIGLAGLPIQSGISRRFERQADRFAVTATRLPQAFASALEKLGALNLADPHPPRWVEWLLYDHPPIAKRIAAAQALEGVSKEP